MIYWLLVVFHIIACVVLIGVILLQSGRGGGLSEMAGGQGVQQTQKLFGTQTNALLMKFTSYCAIAFLITSISLVLLTSRKSKSLMEGARIKPVFSTTTPDGKPMTKEELEAAVKALAEQAKKEGAAAGKAVETQGAKLVDAAQAGAAEAAKATQAATGQVKAASAEAVKSVQTTAQTAVGQAQSTATSVTTAASNAAAAATGESKK